MNNRIILLLAILFGYNLAFSQAYILKVSPEIKTISCEDIDIHNGVVKFKNISDGQNSELSIDDVISINLLEDEPDKLHIINLEFDTISCTIESVLKDKITYREENHTPWTIEKKNVFFVGFGDMGESSRNQNFENTFKQFHKNSYLQKPEIIKKDGTQLEIMELISLDEEKVEIRIKSKEAVVLTYINIKDIGSLIYKDPGDIKEIVFEDNFILTAEDRIVEVDINGFSNGYIDYSIENNGNVVDLVQSLKSINGLYFYDYKNNLELQFSKNNGVSSSDINVKFDINGGIGYLLASSSGHISDQLKDYYDEIRTGFVIETNIHVYLTEYVGLGVKYNHFSTSNSIPDIAEDNVKINFIGGSLLINTPFPNNFGYFFVNLAGGYTTMVNNASALGQALYLKGSTFGVDFALGLDFNITENLALGFQGGVMLAGIKKYEINGQEVELSDRDSLDRIDGLIGLKFYF